jgi:hypothetical protein
VLELDFWAAKLYVFDRIELIPLLYCSTSALEQSVTSAYITTVCTSFVRITPVSTSVDNIDSQLPTDHDDRMSSRGWLVYGIKHDS